MTPPPCMSLSENQDWRWGNDRLRALIFDVVNIGGVTDVEGAWSSKRTSTG